MNRCFDGGTETEIIFPQRVVAHSAAEDVQKLLQKGNMQLILPERGCALIGKGGFVLLDFGAELQGCVRLQFGEVGEGACVRIRTGESAAEACAEPGEKFAGNYHSIRDLVLPAVSHCDTKTGPTGFRFVRIDHAGGGNIALRRAVACSETANLRRSGNFRCSEPLWEQIYETAARTAHLCVQNGHVWDGIKRDRAVWIGDLHPEMLALSQVYGCIPQIKNSLDTAERYFRAHSWVNCIPAYSVWWLICLREYLLLSGDEKYVRGKLGRAAQVIEALNTVVKEDGTVDYSRSELEIFDDNEFFFDWPTNFTPDSRMGWIALAVYGLRRAEELFSHFGVKEELCAALIVRLLKNPLSATSFKQVAAMRVLAGMQSPAAARPVLEEGGARGMTGFMGYYILKAAARCGADVRGMLDGFYGGMLRLGATTFWEDFNVDWLRGDPVGIDRLPPPGREDIHGGRGSYCYRGFRHSLCHGWTAGVIAFFTQEVLGVRPLRPGYAETEIAPRLCGLERAEGTIPTPLGEIAVEHVRKGDAVESRVFAPAGMRVAARGACEINYRKNQ